MLLMRSWLNSRQLHRISLNQFFLTLQHTEKQSASLCSASYICWQRGTARICCGATATKHHTALDQYLLFARPTAANLQLSSLWRANVSADEQTHKRMDTVPLHRPCTAYYAGNATKVNRFFNLLYHLLFVLEKKEHPLNGSSEVKPF